MKPYRLVQIVHIEALSMMECEKRLPPGSPSQSSVCLMLRFRRNIQVARGNDTLDDGVNT